MNSKPRKGKEKGRKRKGKLIMAGVPSGVYRLLGIKIIKIGLN
jgi:hypothetical protein